MNIPRQVPPIASLLALAGGLALTGAAPGQNGGPPRKTAEQLVRVDLQVDTDRVGAGATFNLVVLLEIEPQWHIYWESPGATGMATSVEVDAPDGFEVGPTLFTRPERFGSPDSIDGVTYGYAKHAALLVPLTAPSDLAPGTELKFSAEVMWLVCKKVCLMGQKNATITLVAGEMHEVDEAAMQARSRLPRPLMELEDATVDLEGTRLTVNAPARGFDAAMLFPREQPGVTYGEPEVSIAGGTATITVVVDIARQNALGEPIVIAGVLGLGINPDDPCYAFELPVPDS